MVLLIRYDIKIGALDYQETHDVLSNKINNNVVLSETDMEVYLVEDNYNTALYEPSEGCYLGAYVLGNESLDYNMMAFEKVIGKEHGMYTYNLTLGNEFPSEWVLECIANMKTPLIVINPPSDGILDESLLEDTAKSFGEIDVPIFIEFYADPKRYDVLPENYKNFYAKARNIFKEYSPNSAFVWSVDINNVYDSGICYPGDENVDWVGLSIYEPMYKEDELYDVNIVSNLDFFYNTYNKKKPIMITGFAVSHYSNTDHTYYIEDAKHKINEFYNTIKENYPRIKAINYIDYNGNEHYKVTDDENISKVYNTAIKDDYFKSEIDLNNTEYKKEVFKSSFPVCINNEEIYISNQFLEYELNMMLYSDQKLIYDNMNWYPLNIIKDFKKCDIQIKDKKIYIEILD